MTTIHWRLPGRKEPQECAVLPLPDYEALAARLDVAERLVLKLPCRCVHLGEGEWVECDRCLFLHGATGSAEPREDAAP